MLPLFSFENYGFCFSSSENWEIRILGIEIIILSYSLLQKQLPWQKVHHIVNEAVEIETQFVCEALPCALIGMNSTLMSQYIKFVADRLLVYFHFFGFRSFLPDCFGRIICFNCFFFLFSRLLLGMRGNTMWQILLIGWSLSLCSEYWWMHALDSDYLLFNSIKYFWYKKHGHLQDLAC